jgi:hypothetical protein
MGMSVTLALMAALMMGACAPATGSSSAPAAKGGRMQTTSSGLQYEDQTVGNGASPQPGQTAVVHYTGWLDNGTKFDSSVDRGQPFEFPVGQGRVIKGWDEGVATMKVGGEAEAGDPAGPGLRSAGCRRGHPAECPADLRRGATWREVAPPSQPLAVARALR